MLKKLNKKGFTLTEIIVVLVILAVLAAFVIPSMLGYVDESKNKLCTVSRMDMERLYETSLMDAMYPLTDDGLKTFVAENWATEGTCPSGGTYTYTAVKTLNGQTIVHIDCSVHDGINEHINTIGGILNVLDGSELQYANGLQTGDKTAWSRVLEMTLENNQPPFNIYNFKNPKSSSEIILNYNSIPNNLENPAVFITSNSNYSYANNNSSKLYGSMVFYKPDGSNENKVEYYTIDKDGHKSDVQYYEIQP